MINPQYANMSCMSFQALPESIPISEMSVASIPMNKLIEEVELEPSRLLTWKRFDVIAKYIYGKYESYYLRR